MTDGKTYLEYDGLMQELQRLCDEGRTGTMFITTTHNHSIRFILHEGQITSCVYRVKRGFDALDKIKSMEGGTYRFADDVFTSMDELNLPPTGEILSSLQRRAAPSQSAAPQAAPERASAAKPRARARRPAAGKGMADAIKVIEHELAMFLGPVAAMYCEDYLEDEGPVSNADDLRNMIGAMADEIGDPSKETVFKEQAQGKLKGVL
jgi:hypothetical protein